MSKFAIKGIVVPLIIFYLSLFFNLNSNPNPPPNNALLANMDIWGEVYAWFIQQIIVSVNRHVITCIFASIIDSCRCSSNEDSKPKFYSKEKGKAHEMTVFSNFSASDQMSGDLEGALNADHKDGHARWLVCLHFLLYGCMMYIETSNAPNLTSYIASACEHTW